MKADELRQGQEHWREALEVRTPEDAARAAGAL